MARCKNGTRRDKKTGECKPHGKLKGRKKTATKTKSRSPTPQTNQKRIFSQIENEMVKLTSSQIDELGVYDGDDEDACQLDELMIQAFSGPIECKMAKARKYLELLYS